MAATRVLAEAWVADGELAFVRGEWRVESDRSGRPVTRAHMIDHHRELNRLHRRAWSALMNLSDAGFAGATRGTAASGMDGETLAFTRTQWELACARDQPPPRRRAMIRSHHDQGSLHGVAHRALLAVTDEQFADAMSSDPTTH